MKKFIVFILIFTAMPAFCQTLTGRIKYDVNDARLELQNNKPNPDFLLNTENFDKNYNENNSYILKGITQLKDRKLAKFSDGSYGVNYYDNPKYVWYYDKSGNLINTEIRTSQQYPYKTYKYDLDGALVTMTMRVSEDETFIFNPLGQLLGHWLGEKCYNDNGDVVMTRKIMK